MTSVGWRIRLLIPKKGEQTERQTARQKELRNYYIDKGKAPQPCKGFFNSPLTNAKIQS